jgi:sialidase-1
MRTPQMIVTQAGTYLAFAQGRSEFHDRADNDIVVKRSSDRGRTWSPHKTIADEGKDTLNAICVIQLRKTGRILVIGCWFPDGFEMLEFAHLSPAMQEYQRRHKREHNPAIKPGYEGRNIARTYIMHSDDDGHTWSARRDITRMAKLPPPHLSCVPGPGLALELREGPHAGRILVPCWTRWLGRGRADPERLRYLVKPYAIFSDDGGETWERGELPADGPAEGEDRGDETQFVELPGGDILLNSRAPRRNTAISKDGGRTWSPLKAEHGIKTYEAAAGFLRYSGLGDGAKSRILFSNPADARRIRGVVSLSYDEGKTWPVQKDIRPDRFGYSCLVRLPDDSIGCIFEANVAEGEFPGVPQGRAILLARFTLDWLTDGNGRDRKL